MNSAIQGDDGGNGNIKSLALAVASLSTPAKTVNKLLGIFSFCNDANTPGLAFAAAHPQTEFTAIMEVPDLIKFLISSSFLSSEKPLLVSSSFIGFTMCSGYITFFFKYTKNY